MTIATTMPKLPKKRLFQISISALGVATVLFVLAILPAEFGIDPTGFGHVTGLSRLATAKAKPASTGGLAVSAPRATFADASAVPFRTDVIDIPLASGDQVEGSELEYKVRMKAGASLVYSWAVDAPAGEFYSDFHSQSDPKPKIEVISYRADLGNALAGSLVAPFDGIHGWYLQNQTVKPVTVHLKISGFYRLVPKEELDAAGLAYAKQVEDERLGPAPGVQ